MGDYGILWLLDVASGKQARPQCFATLVPVFCLACAAIFATCINTGKTEFGVSFLVLCLMDTLLLAQ